MIDWVAVGQVLSGLGTIAGAAAIFLAALIGRNALSDFRAEKTAEREIENAEKILTLAYRLKSAMSAIRNPMSGGHEYVESEADLNSRNHLDGLDAAEKKRLIAANVFYLRAKSHNELFAAAFDALPYAKAYFGDDAFENLNILIRARHAVRVYADAYAQDEGRDKDFTYTIQSTIWEGYGKVRSGDELGEGIENSVKKLEASLLPVIRWKPSKNPHAFGRLFAK